MRSRIGSLLSLLVIASLVAPTPTAAHTAPDAVAPPAARDLFPRHLDGVLSRLPAFGAAQNEVVLEGVAMGRRRASLFDLGIYGGGAYSTSWFSVEVEDAEFGGFEMRERADGDRQEQFFDFNLNGAFSVNRRLNRVQLNTGRQLGDYGGVSIRGLDDLGVIRSDSTECSRSRFRRGFAMGRMRVDPTGGGEPKTFRGRFPILIFRDTLLFGDGCPPPPGPPPCFDFTLEMIDDETGTRLVGQYNESTQVLNLSSETSSVNGVSITREIHSRDQGPDLWGFNPVNDRWKLDPTSSFFNTGGGGVSGSASTPVAGEDACGAFDRYVMMLDPDARLDLLVDFVAPINTPSFDASDADLHFTGYR